MQGLKKENEKLVSVIVPAYNHEDYILDCLNSIKGQTYPWVEVIIVDDSSSDRTYSVAKEWVNKNKNHFYRIELLKNDTNSGVVKTVNKGLELCNGHYIMRLASDDCLLDNAVENIVKIYTENPSYGMICFDGLIGEGYDVNPEELTMHTLYSDRDNNTRTDIFQELYGEDFIAAPGCVVRRETYLELGVYDENSWIDDWEYYLRIARKLPILFSKVKIVFFRQVNDSLSHSTNINKRKMMNQGILYVLEKYKDDVPENISKKIMYKKVNYILREVLEWREKDFLNYVLSYMKKNNIKFTMRSWVKKLIMKV